MWAGLQKHSVVLAGYLNMDRLKPTERLGKILVDFEEVNDLQCMILEPTRITPTTATLLDVILTNQPDLFRKCGVHHLALSDHSMVYGIMRDKVCKHQPQIITYRSTKNIDNALLNQDLITAPWHVASIFDDIDDKYDYWNGLFESIVNEHAPIKRKRVRKNDVPYMTKDWKIAIRNKRKYAVRFAKNRTQENFELKKKYRNLATKERRKAIQEYWHKKTEEMHDKPASFFKAFKPFLKESNKQTTHLNLRTDRAIVTDQAEVANLLADYFTSVASNIGGDHVNSLKENDHQEHASIKAIREAKLGSKFDFKLANEVQVAKALDKLQPRKACGWNPSAPPSLLKMAANGVAPSLTHLYNDCIITGKWPWKNGRQPLRKEVCKKSQITCQ